MVMSKKPSGKGYTETNCAAVLAALGDEIVKFEKAKLIMAKCYKITTTISSVQDESKTLTALFGSGAGPDLIRKDVMSIA